MKTRKFILCRYPSTGFGESNNQFYLMNQFGTRFDIVNEYDRVLNEMNKVVRLGNGPYDVFSASTIDELVKAVEESYDASITRW